MTTNWPRVLRAASFRGVPFQTDKEALDNAGRNVAVYDYVKAESHDTEDMGQKSSQKWSLTAYIATDTAQADSEALIAACNAPGAAMLVLPFAGPKLVRCTGCKTSHEKSKLGYVAFELEFVLSGDGAAFSLTVLADRLAEAALEGFAPLAAASIASTRAAAPGALAALRETGAALPALLKPVLILQADSSTVQAEQIRIASETIAGAPDFETAGAGVASALAALRDIARQAEPAAAGAVFASLAAAAQSMIAETQSPGLTLERQPSRHVAVLIEGVARAESLLATVRLPTPAITTATVLSDRAEMLALDSLRDRLASLASLDASDAIAQALTQAIRHRAATQRSRKPVARIDAPRSLPATALSFALFGDPAQAEELARFNRTGTAAFMPTTFFAELPS